MSAFLTWLLLILEDSDTLTKKIRLKNEIASWEYMGRPRGESLKAYGINRCKESSEDMIYGEFIDSGRSTNVIIIITRGKRIVAIENIGMFIEIP